MNKQRDGDDEMSRQDRAKAKKRRALKQTATITDLSDLGQVFGWSQKDVKASYPWDQCVADQMKKYGSRTRAEKICGAIRANAGKDLPAERITALIALSPVTAPNFRAAVAEKSITDAPNLRGAALQCCGNCAYSQAIPGTQDTSGMVMGADGDCYMGRGICTQYDFEVDAGWTCDTWAASADADEDATEQADAGLEADDDSADSADSGEMVGQTMTMERTEAEKSGARHSSSDQQHIDTAVEHLMAAGASLPAMGKDRSVVLFKQSDGRLRVVGWASNNRRDKDNPPELITEAAHKEFMAYLDANPDKAPEFWHWHTPGTAYAKADCWDYVDGFTVYSGLVYPGKEEQAAKAAAPGVGMSHGFRVLGYGEKERLITQYRTFEVSDLPISRAANPYTSFSIVVKEVDMPFSPQKRAYLVDKMGEEAVAGLESRTGEMKAAADALGIETKEAEPAAVATVKAEAAADAAAADNAKPTADAKPADAAAEPKKPADKLDPMIAAEIRGIVREEISAQGKEQGELLGKEMGAKVGAMVKALTERMDTIEANAKAAQTAAEEAAKTATKSFDEAVAEMIMPRRRAPGSTFSPSTAKETVVAAKAGEKLKPAAKDVEEPHLTGNPNASWDETLGAILNKQLGLTA